MHFTLILNKIFNSSCNLCGSPKIKAQETICKECLKTIFEIQRQKPIFRLIPIESQSPRFLKVYALTSFSNQFKKIILYNKQNPTFIFNQIMCELLQEKILNHLKIKNVLPVPSNLFSSTHLVEGVFNYLLKKNTLKSCDFINIKRKIFYKNKTHHLNKNNRNTLDFSKKFQIKINQKNFLNLNHLQQKEIALFDDIITTGATLKNLVQMIDEKTKIQISYAFSLASTNKKI
jgi:predicted amidophosphoribosyltransferase